MVRVEVIRKRLNKLDEYLSILHRLQRYSLEEFTTEPERYGSAERFLHLIVEAFSDIGNHLVADLGLGVVDTYSDIPYLLYDADYIDLEMREQWIRMIGFRNILVHDYLDVDRKVVHEVLQKNLDDIKALRNVFAQFI